jgi:hypothetical protein
MSANTQEINTHDVVIPFGKHKGERLTRLPVSYIRWMSNEPTLDAKWKELAKSEFERRGDTMPEINLSGHAIDNASLRCRRRWHETAKDQDEGLYSWLHRISLEALVKGEKLENGKIEYLGLKFVFAEGDEYPSLKTIMPA